MINQSKSYQSIPANAYRLPNETSLPEPQKKLLKACVDFEAMILRQMLQNMQGSTKLFGEGFGGSYYQSLFQDQMAQKIAGKGFGLANMLYYQLNRENSAKEMKPQDGGQETTKVVKTGETEV